VHHVVSLVYLPVGRPGSFAGCFVCQVVAWAAVFVSLVGNFCVSVCLSICCKTLVFCFWKQGSDGGSLVGSCSSLLSCVPCAHQKPSFKYFGRYRVVARVGSVAYKLDLSTSSRIHPVIHVSWLKLGTGFKGTAFNSLPSKLLWFNIPLQILQTRGVLVE
jgi:hypothetical protein